MFARRIGTILASLAVGAAAALGPAGEVAGAGTEPTATDSRPHILAFVRPANGGALLRLRAELALAGFDLLLTEETAWPPSRDEMERLARERSAVAALALIPREDGAATEIWVVDRVTGKTVVRVFTAARPGHGDEPELLAVSVVETLRATMMEINLARPAGGEVAPPPEVRALVAPEPRRFAVRIGSGIGYNREGSHTAWQLGLAVTVALSPRLRFGIDGALPLTSAGVTGPEGQADVRLWLAGPFLEVSLTDPTARVDLTVGAGVWAALLRMRGNAAAPYMGVDADVTTVMPHADIGLRWRVGRRVGIGGVLAIAVATPEAVVRFSGRDAARWGRPLGLAMAVIEARLD
jgi:hypothetical protein